MRIVMQEDNHFGGTGPGIGTYGEVIGFVYTVEDIPETMFLCTFDGHEGVFWVYPKQLGVYDGRGTYPCWQWREGWL